MATETTDAAGKAAESAGMPQLDFSTFANQIFWLVVTLVVIYLVLSKVALPRIASVLAERQGTITNDLGAERAGLAMLVAIAVIGVGAALWRYQSGNDIAEQD